MPVGDIQYSGFTAEDLKSFTPAFAYLISRLQSENLSIVVIVNDGLKQEITENMVEICKNYNVKYVQLKDIDKISGHPTALGMRQIATQVKDSL